MYNVVHVVLYVHAHLEGHSRSHITGHFPDYTPNEGLICHKLLQPWLDPVFYFSFVFLSKLCLIAPRILLQ